MTHFALQGVKLITHCREWVRNPYRVMTISGVEFNHAAIIIMFDGFYTINEEVGQHGHFCKDFIRIPMDADKAAAIIADGKERRAFLVRNLKKVANIILRPAVRAQYDVLDAVYEGDIKEKGLLEEKGWIKFEIGGGNPPAI